MGREETQCCALFVLFESNVISFPSHWTEEIEFSFPQESQIAGCLQACLLTITGVAPSRRTTLPVLICSACMGMFTDSLRTATARYSV